jgi:hypothetical protein
LLRFTRFLTLFARTQNKAIIPNKYFDEETNSTKTELHKYEAAGLAVGKKPEITIEYLKEKPLVVIDEVTGEEVDSGRTDTTLTVIASDKFKKPTKAIAKAFIDNKEKELVPIPDTKTAIAVESAATAGAKQANIKKPAIAVASTETGTFVDHDNLETDPDGSAYQQADFETGKPSKFVKDEDEGVKSLLRIKGQVAIVDKETGEIEKLLDEKKEGEP